MESTTFITAMCSAFTDAEEAAVWWEAMIPTQSITAECSAK